MIYAEPLSQIVHKLKHLLHVTFVIENERKVKEQPPCASRRGMIYHVPLKRKTIRYAIKHI